MRISDESVMHCLRVHVRHPFVFSRHNTILITTTSLTLSALVAEIEKAGAYAIVLKQLSIDRLKLVQRLFISTEARVPKRQEAVQTQSRRKVKKPRNGLGAQHQSDDQARHLKLYKSEGMRSAENEKAGYVFSNCSSNRSLRPDSKISGRLNERSSRAHRATRQFWETGFGFCSGARPML